VLDDLNRGTSLNEVFLHVVVSDQQLAHTHEQIALQKLRQILSEREVAEWLGISQPTLSRHRRYRTGPPYIRLSTRRVGYRRDAVEAWLKEREQKDNQAAAGVP
jgi:predicted DNA-binding transcriptional regulator AlpA